MQLPQIRIQSQQALITIQTNDAKQSIQQPKATQQIEQPAADIRMHTTPSKLTIDQTQAWNDMGLKSAKTAIKDAARAGRQDVMQGIARRARQGNELMKIENNGNPLISQAITNGNKPQKAFNIGWIPSVFAVKTDYQPADLQIDVTVNKPIIKNTANKPILQYQPGNVETSVSQEADLNIDFENLKFHSLNFEMSI